MDQFAWDFARMVALLFGPMVVGLPIVAALLAFFAIVGQPG